MKKTRVKKEFLEQLIKAPIVQVACEKVGLSRNSVYRWRKKDRNFCVEMDNALAEGESLINDMAESQIIMGIKNGVFQNSSFWLRHHHKNYIAPEWRAKKVVEKTGATTLTDLLKELAEHKRKIRNNEGGE